MTKRNKPTGGYYGLKARSEEITPMHRYQRITPAVKSLGKGTPAAGFSGDNGAVAIWVGDDGVYRGEHWRYQATIDEIECSTQGELIDWLKIAVPKTKG